MTTKTKIYSKEIWKYLNLSAVPQHVAIIPDGNRRWAKKNFISAAKGHNRGADVVADIVEAAQELGIRFLTIYSFSTENWRRSRKEVQTLMRLLKNFLLIQKERMINEGVRLNWIGDISALPEDLQGILLETKHATSPGTSLDLILALNYGGRDEITRMVKKIVIKDLDESEITEETLGHFLDTSAWPDPELLIRTSGEYRMSNFLLWQTSYAEFYLTEKLWPDFTPQDLLEAVMTYQERKQRKGA